MSIEAMKQALEALENGSPDNYPEGAGVFYNAIEALRTAIEQAEKQGPWEQLYLDMGKPQLAYPAPPQRQPLTPREISEFVGTHEFGPEQLRWFRFGEAAHGVTGEQK